METNIGSTDQIIRIVGLIMAALYYFTHPQGGFASTVAGILVIYFIMTALTKYSPVWEILGISTEKKVLHK